MVYSITACPLGRLSELATHKHNLPRLQFEDGDLVIKLGHSPSEWLIIHSKVFAAVSPVFNDNYGIANEDWADLIKIKHPRTGNEVPVRVLALEIIDDTYVLEGKDVVLEIKGRQTVPYHKSALVGEGWSLAATGELLAPPAYDATEAAHALRVFFTLAYGANLGMEKITGNVYPRRILAQVCAYAEYWECFEAVRPAIVEALMANEAQLWKDVAFRATEHAILAKKLRIPELYRDAIRHMVGRAYAVDYQLHSVGYRTVEIDGLWGNIAEIMELEMAEVRTIFPWQLQAVKKTGAKPGPDGLVPLVGRNWADRQQPRFANVYDPSVVGYPTFMAVPSQVPWDTQAVGVGEHPARALRGAVSTEDASDEWVQTLVELLERR